MRRALPPISAALFALAALALSPAHRAARAQAPPEPSPSPSPTPASTPSPAPLPPLAGDWLEPFGPLGFVSPPTGSTEPRPVVIAVHGRMDRADWACAEWRAVLGPRPFLVCPQGAPMPPGFAWSGGATQLRGAIDRLLDAAQAKYGPHLDRDHRVFAGFSQGAIVASRLVCDDGAPYPLALFEEGFPDDLAARCARSRGALRRVLLGCSQPGCEATRRPLVAPLARAGVAARVHDAGPRGHTMDGVVLASLRSELPWLLEGDPFWRAALSPR